MRRYRLIPIVASFLLIVGCNTQQGTDPVSVETEEMFLAALSGSEQPHGRFLPGDRGLLSALELTETQQTQIKSIMQEHWKQRRPLRGAAGERPSREQMEAQRQQHREALREQIHAVLTPAQQEKLAQFEAQLQRGEVPQALIDAHIARLAAEVQLSDEQVAKLKALDSWQQHLLARPGFGKRDQDRQQVRETARKHAEQVEAILTPEQQAKLQSLRNQRREQMKSRLQEHRGEWQERRLEHLSEALALTAEQREQIAGILADVEFPARGPHAERPGREQRQERMQAMQQKMQEVDARIKALLTPEQQAKFDELKQEHRQKMQHRRFGRGE